MFNYTKSNIKTNTYLTLYTCKEEQNLTLKAFDGHAEPTIETFSIPIHSEVESKNPL